MEEIKLCRVCLIMDVTMYDLQSYPLNSYFEFVMENNLLTIVNSPPFACYECAALVKKFYLFKQKSLKSQAILNSLLDHSNKVSITKLKEINRQNLGLCSNLILYSTPVPGQSIQDLESSGIIEDENLIEYKLTKIDVKEEYGVPDSCSNGEEPILFVDNTYAKDHKTEDDNNLDGLEATNDTVSIKKKSATASKLLIDELVDHVTVTKLSFSEQIEEINKRKESANYLNSPFKCNLCYKGFLDTATWKLHRQKHSPSAGSAECPICKTRFKTKSRMHGHLVRHETKYACNYCAHVSSVPNQAKYHLGQHKGVTYTCKYCGEIFTVRSTYLSHVRIKHPSQFICNICGCSYINQFGLQRHKVVMHRDVMQQGEKLSEDSKYCEECDVNFVSMAAYKRHTVGSTKHIKSVNDCSICGETFNGEEEMKMHRRKEHPKKRSRSSVPKPNLKWPVKCEHCLEEIQNGHHYRSHYRRAHPDKKYPVQKNFVCDICGKSFAINAHLVYHHRTHSCERPYKCAQCDKTFATPQTLQVHAKSHSEERPFVCDVCHKGFKFKYAIKRHLTSHTGERPYQCEICNKTFSTAGNRKLHVNTVHFRQPGTFISRKRKRGKNIDKEHPH